MRFPIIVTFFLSLLVLPAFGQQVWYYQGYYKNYVRKLLGHPDVKGTYSMPERKEDIQSAKYPEVEFNENCGRDGEINRAVKLAWMAEVYAKFGDRNGVLYCVSQMMFSLQSAAALCSENKGASISVGGMECLTLDIVPCGFGGSFDESLSEDVIVGKLGTSVNSKSSEKGLDGSAGRNSTVAPQQAYRPNPNSVRPATQARTSSVSLPLNNINASYTNLHECYEKNVKSQDQCPQVQQLGMEIMAYYSCMLANGNRQDKCYEKAPSVSLESISGPCRDLADRMMNSLNGIIQGQDNNTSSAGPSGGSSALSSGNSNPAPAGSEDDEETRNHHALSRKYKDRGYQPSDVLASAGSLMPEGGQIKLPDGSSVIFTARIAEISDGTSDYPELRIDIEYSGSEPVEVYYELKMSCKNQAEGMGDCFPNAQLHRSPLSGHWFRFPNDKSCSYQIKNVRVVRTEECY